MISLVGHFVGQCWAAVVLGQESCHQQLLMLPASGAWLARVEVQMAELTSEGQCLADWRLRPADAALIG